MTFSNALPRLRGAVAPVRTLSFRRIDGSKLVRVKARRSKPRRAAPGDANVALIMAVMMTLVFGPVIGVHLIAAFGHAAPASDLAITSTGTPLPRG
ncbi:hypothetical protein [Methylobacterium sp. Leaf117]|uniref:hypothetical protein n=1 Tax=Methylobacterium sp. Leaf117 TaxID=1736260 RepID=UPI000B0B89D5|nr:hypothetical protein [Methylobacterium sp. Leaf117]